MPTRERRENEKREREQGAGIPEHAEALRLLGAYIKQRRETCGLSIRQVSETLGIDRVQISWFERGEVNFSILAFLRICSLLGVPADELVPPGAGLLDLLAVKNIVQGKIELPPPAARSARTARSKRPPAA